MHFGIISPPVPGHLNPFGALGRELIARGHRVTLFHMADVESRACGEELEFVTIGQADHPPGALPKSLATLGTLDGLKALRFTIGEVTNTTRMMLRDGPDAISRAGVNALLVDQTEAAGASIAELLKLPFITVCNALLLNREPGVPPAFSDWQYRSGLFARMRNRIGYALSDRALKRVRDVVNRHRREWGLAPQGPEQSFSALAQISQQPRAFDYPRQSPPAALHYVGPLRRPAKRTVPFPWDKLDGRPLVYASLGTLQNGKEHVFRIFAEACTRFDVQLVITHGGGLDERTASGFPGHPLVVSYAPQLEVLQRASLTLTHAGLNTVLDSLSCGVSMLAVPITYEQPAIAERIRWCGAGKAIPFRKLSSASAVAAIRELLENPEFQAAAKRVQKSIADAGGVRRAADIIEGNLPAGSTRARDTQFGERILKA